MTKRVQWLGSASLGRHAKHSKSLKDLPTVPRIWQVYTAGGAMKVPTGPLWIRPCGRMVGTTFVECLHQFITHVHHQRQIQRCWFWITTRLMSIDFIDLAADNGIVVLTILLHTSYKLQPLDICVYVPFKRLYNREIDTWHVSHHRSIWKSCSKAASPTNVISRFVTCGIQSILARHVAGWAQNTSLVTDLPSRQRVHISQSQLANHSADSDVPIAQAPLNLPSTLKQYWCYNSQHKSRHWRRVCFETTKTPLSICPLATASVQETMVTVFDSAASVTPLSIRPLAVAPAGRHYNVQGHRAIQGSQLLHDWSVGDQGRGATATIESRECNAD